MTTDVWPPAMFSHTQPAHMGFAVAPAPTTTRLLKFPATPPRVTPEMDVGLEVEPRAEMATARQLPVVVAPGSVTVTAPPEAGPLSAVWTRFGPWLSSISMPSSVHVCPVGAVTPRVCDPAVAAAGVAECAVDWAGG